MMEFSYKRQNLRSTVFNCILMRLRHYGSP